MLHKRFLLVGLLLTVSFSLVGQTPQNLVLVIITLLQLEGFTIGLVSYAHCILPNLRNQCSGITFSRVRNKLSCAY